MDSGRVPASTAVGGGGEHCRTLGRGGTLTDVEFAGHRCENGLFLSIPQFGLAGIVCLVEMVEARHAVCSHPPVA